MSMAGFQSLKCSKNCLHLLTTSVARVKTFLIADGHPTRKWEYKHYYWVDDHPLLHGKKILYNSMCCYPHVFYCGYKTSHVGQCPKPHYQDRTNMFLQPLHSSASVCASINFSFIFTNRHWQYHHHHRLRHHLVHLIILVTSSSTSSSLSSWSWLVTFVPGYKSSLPSSKWSSLAGSQADVHSSIRAKEMPC